MRGGGHVCRAPAVAARLSRSDDAEASPAQKMRAAVGSIRAARTAYGLRRYHVTSGRDPPSPIPNVGVKTNHYGDIEQCSKPHKMSTTLCVLLLMVC